MYGLSNHQLPQIFNRWCEAQSGFYTTIREMVLVCLLCIKEQQSAEFNMLDKVCLFQGLFLLIDKNIYRNFSNNISAQFLPYSSFLLWNQMTSLCLFPSCFAVLSHIHITFIYIMLYINIQRHLISPFLRFIHMQVQLFVLNAVYKSTA